MDLEGKQCRATRTHAASAFRDVFMAAAKTLTTSMPLACIPAASAFADARTCMSPGPESMERAFTPPALCRRSVFEPWDLRTLRRSTTAGLPLSQ